MKFWLKYFVILFCLKFIEGSQSFRCDYEYNSGAKGWFKHIVVPATWTDAQLRCSLEGAVLASPITRQIKAAMTDIINCTQSEEEHEIFTGIHATFSQGDYYSVEETSFRSDYKYSSKSKGWFKSFVVPATWFDARLRCSLEGAILASPTTPEIQTEMRNILNNSNPESIYFSGIHATFSQGDYYTIEGTPLSKITITWAQNEPDNKDNQESCITFNGLGEIADHRCDVIRPYICYRSESFQAEVSPCGTVDPDYHLDMRTGKCYKFHLIPRNFSRAFFACSAEGGHLAIINSETEATVLKELFAKYPDNDLIGFKGAVYVGCHDWGEKFDWRITIPGQTLAEAGYSKFDPAQPDNAPPGESCGTIFRSGLLNDLWCVKLCAFICEKNPDYPDAYRVLAENGQHN